MSPDPATPLMPEDDYRQLVLQLADPITESEKVPLDDSLGRILTAALVSKVDLPPFQNSAMDGYAVRAQDTQSAPVTLAVAGDIPAGSTSQHELAPGTAIRIMTGAPIPPGADAVIRVEWTDAGIEQVELYESVAAGAELRDAAGDLAVGDQVAQPGDVVDPGLIGLLAASGHAEVSVLRRPRVAVVATGDELYPVGTELPVGGIYDSNSHQVSALVRRAGAEVGDVMSLTDNIESAVAALEQLAATHDLIITTGGVSAGAYEVVRDVFARTGTAQFLGVAIQPGKPQGHGTIAATPVVALPGNPVSALVSFELFARPLIRKLAGKASYESTETDAVCVAPFKRRLDRTRYLPAALDLSTRQVTTPTVHGSHLVSTARNTNCLIRVPGVNATGDASEGDVISAGSTVRVVLLD